MRHKITNEALAGKRAYPLPHQTPVCLVAPSIEGTGIMSERKAVIKNADMSEDMQQDAIDCATQVLF